MRALSSLLVFLSHIIQIFWLPVLGLRNWIYSANNLLSESAVIVFFLLSGYLISMSIWKNVSGAGHFSVAEYAISRLARIYPPLLCSVIVALAVFLIINVTGLPGIRSPLKHSSDLYTTRDFLTLVPREVLSALVMKSGMLAVNGPLWTLYIEVKLYIAAGAAAFLLKGDAPLLWRAVAGAGVFVILILFGILRQPEFTLYAIWWLLGAAFFLSQLHAQRGLVLSLVSAFLGAAILLLSVAPIAIEFLRVIILLGLSYLMFFRWTWSSVWLEEVAAFSYTLYLTHFPILILCYSFFLSMHGLGPPTIFHRSLTSVLALAVALTAANYIGGFAENTAYFKRLIWSSFKYVLRNSRANNV